MSAKKGGKKKKIVHRKEKEIKQMPSLVYNSIRVTPDDPAVLDEPKKTESIKEELIPAEAKKPVAVPNENLREKFVADQMSRESKLSFWLWVGVVGLGALIVIFWGYSLWFNVSTINWKKSDENKLLTQTTDDWNKTFQATKENETQKKLSEAQIKELLSKAIQAQQMKNIPTTTTSTAANSTTSTTSTNQNTTTTIISNTTTTN